VVAAGFVHVRKGSVMSGCEVIAVALETTQATLEAFIADFSDADLLVRPVPGANHAAWQLGNVVIGDPFLVTAILPETVYPTLPAGFADLHGSKASKIDADAGFLTKDGYLALLRETRAVTIAAVRKLSEADLDRPTGEAMAWCGPTFAHVLLFAAQHTMQHAGQFSVIRRKLAKPVVF